MVWKIFLLKTKPLALIEAASFLFFWGLSGVLVCPKKNKKIQRKARKSSLKNGY
jgi:hypothetical protein